MLAVATLTSRGLDSKIKPHMCRMLMQAPGLESVPTPELLSDAEILSSIKSTLTRKQTMSLPLHLLKGNPSLDALENALRAESTLFPRAQSMRKRMVPGSQVG